MNIAVLEEIGFTKNEAKVYLGLLELGPVSATSIIEQTGLHRAIVYDTLQRLNEKGLLGYVTKEKKKIYEATNPQRLQDTLKEKEQKLGSILPKLMELSESRTTLGIRSYKGHEGMKTIFEDILRTKPTEWLVIGSGGENHHLSPRFHERFHERRIQEGIKLRGLFRSSQMGQNRGETLSSRPLTQIKYLPAQVITPSVVHIYDDRVALFSLTPEAIHFIALIQNKDLAASFREYFEWSWKLGE